MSFFTLMAQRPSNVLVENKGQWPGSVIAAADVQGGKVFLEKGSITYHLFDLAGMRADHDVDPEQPRVRGHIYRMQFAGSNATQMQALLDAKQQSYSNYFLGNDPSHWAGQCGHYHQASIQSLYPGIDLQMHGDGPFLKYDLIVQPFADASQITMIYEGHDKLALENERLVVYTSVGDVTEQKPLAWQIIQGEKHPVQCRFVVKKNTVSFDFPKGFDNRYALIIDPELVFSTYSGSTSNNFGYTATYDAAGALYSGSSAFGQGYPTNLGSYDSSHNGGDSGIEQGIDIALSKYSSNGTNMYWSTFLGGSGDELPHSIIVNDLEELIVYGSTGSADFPITTGAIDNSFGGGGVSAPTGTGASFPNGTDIIVSHFSAFGETLLGSTYIGGSGNDGICDATALKYNYADEFRGEVSLDADNNILIVSSTRSFDITTENAVQAFPGGGQDALIAKLNPTLNTVLWMTYFGSTGDDSGFSITDNEAGEHYICGGTTSPTLNLGGNGAQNSYGGGVSDAYVVRLSAAGNQLTGGTYWGSTTYDQAYFVEADADGFVYIFGQTTATGSTLIQNATYGTANSGNLLAKFSANLNSVIWSTVIGTGDGKPNLSPSAFLVDYCNRIYISGWGVNDVAGNPLNPNSGLHAMFNLPTSGDAYDASCSTGDFYMAVFDENMTQLEYATFFGGGTSQEHVDGGTSRFDKKGIIYQSVCAGCGGNDDFPILPGNAYSSINGTTGGCNNGVFKFDFQLPLSVADFYVTPTVCEGNAAFFYDNSIGVQTWLWDFGDGTTSQDAQPSHLYAQAGTYVVTLTVSSGITCNGSDSMQQTITVTEPQTVALDDAVVCGFPNNVLSVPSTQGIFSWSPAENLSDPNGFSTYYNGTTSQDFTITQLNNGCITTFLLHADVLQFTSITEDIVLCDPTELTLSCAFEPNGSQIVWSESNQWGFNVMLNDDSTDVDIVVQAVTSDVYYAAIFNGDCLVSRPVYISFVDAQTAIQEDFTVCGADVVELSVLTPNPTFNYHWEPDALIVAGQNTSVILANISETTTFSVHSISPDGCEASDEVVVSVSNLGSDDASATASDYIIATGESTQLNANPTGFAYSWTPTSSLSNASIANPVASPEEDTVYTLTITDGECTASDTVSVRVLNFLCGPPNIYVPNAFTPNADDKNEKLYVRGVNLTEVHLVIFDRWGEVVFETRSLQDGWDATFKGKAVDPDVFVYYLEAVCAGGEEYFEEGNITVIR